MRRVLPIVLLLAGCGGHGGAASSTDDFSLGAASIDLTVGGTHAPGPMVGTGSARGQVGFVPSDGATAGFGVDATLLGAKGKAGTDRQVRLVLGGASYPAAGQAFTIGSRGSAAYYIEIARRSGDDDFTIPEDWTAASGTVTVERVGNGMATVRLTNVVCPGATGSDDSAPQVTLSGTITGPIVVGNAA